MTLKEIEEIEYLTKKVYEDDDEAWRAGIILDGNYLGYLKSLLAEVKRLQNELTIKTLENAKGAQVLSDVEEEAKRLRGAIELKNRALYRYLPCPDHRDKVESGRCYLCDVEKLRGAIKKYLNEGR